MKIRWKSRQLLAHFFQCVSWLPGTLSGRKEQREFCSLLGLSLAGERGWLKVVTEERCCRAAFSPPLKVTPVEFAPNQSKAVFVQGGIKPKKDEEFSPFSKLQSQRGLLKGWNSSAGTKIPLEGGFAHIWRRLPLRSVVNSPPAIETYNSGSFRWYDSHLFAEHNSFLLHKAEDSL